MKYQQKIISTEKKLDVVNQPTKGERIVDIQRNVIFALSSVRTIRDYEDKIEESAMSGTNVSAKTSTYSRISTMERMEKVLNAWIEDQNQRHVPVSML